MTINVDRFLNRVPTLRYKCIDFVREVWLDAYGEDIAERLKGYLATAGDRAITRDDLKRFNRLKNPTDTCFVLLQRSRRVAPHVGIWYCGKVLHLAAGGAEYMPLRFVARRYPRVSFFL